MAHMRKVKDPDQQPATKADVRAVGNRVGSLEAKVDSLETKFDSLEVKVDSLDNAVKNQALKLLEHDRRFDKIENLIKSSESRILSAVDTLSKIVLDAYRTQLMHGRHFADHDEDIKDLKKRVTKIEAVLSS